MSGMRGKKHSPETIEKMRQAKLGKKNPMYGKHPVQVITDEAKRNMSKAQKKRFREQKHPRSGTTHSEQSRKKMAKARTGKALSKKTRQKLSKIHTGEKHWNWKKDRSLLKVSEKKHLDVQYREWMMNVKSRDNWTCRIDNENCSGRLEAHHILDWVNYPELRYSLTNGVTLCQAHHPRGRAKEKRFVSLVTTLIDGSNVSIKRH